LHQVVQAGRREPAEALARRLGADVDGPPRLLAAIAQLQLWAGDPATACSVAERALASAEGDPTVRLIHAWCLLRAARQRDDDTALPAVREWLERAQPTRFSERSLLQAVRAGVEVRVGDPQLGRWLAQEALRRNRDSEDALAALAEAAGVLGDTPKARAAYQQLVHDFDETAKNLRARMRRLGVLEEGPLSVESCWLPLENALTVGALDVARRGLEEQAEGVRSGNPSPGPAASESARNFLSLSPVFRHFGSYDYSFLSLERLEVGITLLYGTASRPIEESESGALLDICGRYLGETLCRGAGLAWTGPNQSLCSGRGLELDPGRLMRDRVSHGQHAPLRTVIDRVRARGGAEIVSAAPDGPAPAPELQNLTGNWPTAAAAQRLARALRHSPVGRYTELYASGPLDLSRGSLRALEDYLALVAPYARPLSAGTAWTRWVTTLAGAYVGETVRRTLDGLWRDQASDPCIEVPGKPPFYPFRLVLARVTGAAKDWLHSIP
jgi:hypothetical protein